MDARTLQDRIRKGMGVAARRAGCLFNLYRPAGIVQPVSPGNRIMALSAAFKPFGGRAGVAYGQSLWSGTFDSSYTQPGDYLVNASETYFVASQLPGLDVQCVLANRVVSIVRPMPAMQGGYSGFFSTPGDVVITEWPACLLESGGYGDGGRVGETRFGGWRLLLPVLPAAPQIGDVVSDDLGGAYVVGSAEQSVLGWRLAARQVGA